jgi:hypothetical protein
MSPKCHPLTENRFCWIDGMVGLLVAGAVLLVAVCCIPRLRVNEASWDKIRPGLTLEEVEGIVGGPLGAAALTRSWEGRLMAGWRGRGEATKATWSWCSMPRAR